MLIVNITRKQPSIGGRYRLNFIYQFNDINFFSSTSSDIFHGQVESDVASRALTPGIESHQQLLNFICFWLVFKSQINYLYLFLIHHNLIKTLFVSDSSKSEPELDLFLIHHNLIKNSNSRCLPGDGNVAYCYFVLFEFMIYKLQLSFNDYF